MKGFICFIFIFAIQAQALPPNRPNIPNCGWTQNQKKIRNHHWSKVLEVEILVEKKDSTESFRGLLCAASEEKSSHSIGLISFHSSGGFDEVFKIEDLIEKNQTLYSNKDLAELTLGSYLVRAGELLTLNLLDIKEAKQESIYGFSLRFPKDIFRSFITKQSQDFYEFSFSIHREHETEKVFSTVTAISAAPKGAGKKLTLTVPYMELGIKNVSIETDEKIANLLLKDLNLKTGAFATLPNVRSVKVFKSLRVREADYRAQLKKENAHSVEPVLYQNGGAILAP